MTVIAKYSGVCTQCDGAFSEGSYIIRCLDGWAHDVCPDPIPEAQRDICPSCFTERAANGRCMCP